MNDYVNTHLQQRKSSLANLAKNSSRQSLKVFSDIKNTPLDHLKESSSSNIYNNQQILAPKPPSKNPQKDINQTIQSIDSSLAKSRGKVQQQQNGDYIRNLYKKYLGKENKQSSQRLNAYTERKLRTTESRQILISNTGAKDFTKRALFRDSQNENLYPNDKKIQKSRELTLGCHEIQANDQGLKSQMTNQSRASLKTKKQSVKKNEKELPNEKQKNDTKKYKSKQKVEKAPEEKDHKLQKLQKSQSTRLKWPQSKKGQNHDEKRKLLKQGVASGKQEQKIKIKEKVMQGVVHPHRESYCQFDTEQETSNSKMIIEPTLSRQTKISKEASHQKITFEQISSQIINSKVVNYCKEGCFGSLEELALFLGEQNSVLRALKRIHRVKQLNMRKKSGLSSQKERRSFAY